jgi:type I restriction enzyme R subunit
MPTPEEEARQRIDQLLDAAGWRVQDRHELNLGAAVGVAVCEFPLTTGFADYLLFVKRRPIGVVELQSETCNTGLQTSLSPWCWPLPCLYGSTGEETSSHPHPRPRFPQPPGVHLHKLIPLAEGARGWKDHIHLVVQTLLCIVPDDDAEG